MSGSVIPMQVLSVAPWFDDEVAGELLELARETPDARLRYQAWKVSGALASRRGLWRVTDPLRSELRKQLLDENEPVYKAALSVYVAHARNGLGERLSVVMGEHGSGMAVAVADFVSADDELSGHALKQLTRLVRAHGGKREGVLAGDVARLIDVFGPRRSRAATLFNGMSLWAQGRRLEAVSQFESVLTSGEVDIATAIAAHLVGVSRLDEGRLREAHESVSESVRVGREILDTDGLVQTLSTLARTERAIFKQDGDVERLRAAREAIVEAESQDEDARMRSRRLEYLAQILADSGEYGNALAAATEAAELVEEGEAAVEARTTMALIQRDSGDNRGYRASLLAASEIAARDQVGGIPFARLLNMEASSRRKEGDWRGAEDLARRSLAIGRTRKDRRHIGHSAHTLASSLVDRMNSEADLSLAREIEALIAESRGALVRLRDAQGVGMVDMTRQRFVDVRSRLLRER